MSLLRSFRPDSKVAVIGASGGIGQALVEKLSSDPRVGGLYAFARNVDERSDANSFSGVVDILDEATISHAAETATRDDLLDLVIVSTGMLWRGSERQPERAMREVSREGFQELFAVNTVGPSLVAKHFLPRLRKGAKTVFAALSARVGSIGDNRLGGWYSYRASKAALNMVLKTLSIEHARRWPESAVIGLHPGTVATALSRPFTARTPADRIFSPEAAADYLIRVVDNVTPENTGRILAWDGQQIDY